MKIVITGGSGFLGSKLSERLLKEGHTVISIDIVPPKNNKVGFVKANISESLTLQPEIENPDVVINLAGAPIGAKWTEKYKEIIYKSRVLGTKNLVLLMKNPAFCPKTFISASAVGIYGDREDEILDEDSKIKENQGFLAYVAKNWEYEAKIAEELGVRTVILRQGHILGMGGLIQTLLPYYKWGIGGPIGSGKQYFPWIHIEDLINLYIYSMYEDFSGVLNAVAGEPVTNKDFSSIFARVLKRPHVLFIPVFALKIIYGEFAEEIVKSQRVVTSHKLKNFIFKFNSLEMALKNIFS